MARTFLDNRHPEYNSLEPDWSFWSQSYNGGEEYAQAGHLFKHPRESKKAYEERLKRADRNNFTRQVQDLIVQYLYKEKPTRKNEKASESILRFWNNVDGKGTKIDDFMRQLATKVGLFGTYYVVIDKPQGIATTKAEQEALGLFPYAYTVSPVDVLDVVFNGRTGEIEQIMIRETTRGEVSILDERESNGLKTQYRVWLKTPEGVKWMLYEKGQEEKPSLIREGNIGLKQIPIRKITRGASTYGGMSVVGDIATLDRAIYNYNSCCDQIIYDQTFSTLTLEYDGQMVDFFENWEIVVGTKSALPYPRGGNPPAYISPDASQGEFILKRIDQKVTQIYQVQNLQDTMGNSQQGQPQKAQSGVAKGWDFEKLNAGLCEYGNVMEQAEEAMALLVNLWEGETKPIEEDLIDYPESFDIKSLTDELNEFNLLTESVSSDTYRKLLEKRLVSKGPKLEKDEMEAVKTEIEASMDIAQEQAKAALQIQKKQASQPPAKG